MQETPASPPIDLSAWGDGLNAAVIGASGGIGGALADALQECPQVAGVLRLCRSAPDPGTADGPAARLDIEDEASIAAAAGFAAQRYGRLHLVIVATGILHGGGLRPEKSWRDLSGDAMERAFRVNAAGPTLVAKHFLPLLAEDRKSVFAALSARVGSIGDNRLGGWHAYRASKAALNMIVRTLAVELGRRNGAALCVGLHPGTVDTPLSKPFQHNVPEGKLFSPDRAARCLLDVLAGLGPQHSGRVFAWDGSEVPF